MQSLADNPQLAALGNQLGAAASAPSTAAPASAHGGGQPPVPPPSSNAGGSNNGGRQFKLPFWAAMVIAAFLLLFCTYRVVYNMNWNAPFALSDSLDHQGPWYRQMTLAPIDWVRARQYYVEADFWGRKRVVYLVGDRQFVQARSGEPAVEVYPSK